MTESKPVRKPDPAPDDAHSSMPWASGRGEFLVAVQACGCEVKVRDRAAAQLMAATRCRKHSV